MKELDPEVQATLDLIERQAKVYEREMLGAEVHNLEEIRVLIVLEHKVPA